LQEVIWKVPSPLMKKICHGHSERGVKVLWNVPVVHNGSRKPFICPKFHHVPLSYYPSRNLKNNGNELFDAMPN